MNQEQQEHEEREDSDDRKDKLSPEARRLRVDRDRKELIKSVAAEDFSTLKARVAAVLNLYPSARDSALAEMKASVQRELSQHHDGLTVGDLTVLSSRQSSLLQLADIVAGAANRRRNHDGERNVKDDFADLIIDNLGLAVDEGDNEDFDSSTVLAL